MTKKRIRIISSLDFFIYLFCRLFQFAIHCKVIHCVHKEDKRGSGMLRDLKMRGLRMSKETPIAINVLSEPAL